jgi:hypothetical protein
VALGALILSVTAYAVPRGAKSDARSARELATGSSARLSTVDGVAALDPTATISMVPVPAQGTIPGNYTIAGDTATVDLEPGETNVYLEIHLTGWDPETLKTWQAKVDSGCPTCTNPGNGYYSGDGCELYPDTDEACLPTSDCIGFFGGWSKCDPPPPAGGFCLALGQDDTRSDWVFENLRPGAPWYGPGWAASSSPATLDYSYGAASLGACSTDMGTNVYGGSLAVTVPTCALGTYEIGLLPGVPGNELSFMGDCQTPSQVIPLAGLPSAFIEVETGSCCFWVGNPAAGCGDGFNAFTCASAGGITIFRPGVACDNPPTADGCCECLTNLDCDDGDACTVDTCTDCVCSYDPLPGFDPADDCCDPATGDIAPRDDGVQCTTDVCSLGGSAGVPVHDPETAGTPCDDGQLCTVDDECDGVGTGDTACSGTPYDSLMIPCTTIADCPVPGTECSDGYCICKEDVDIYIEFSGGSKPNPNCFELEEKVSATIMMGPSAQPVNGAQFWLFWDPTCIAFDDIAPADPYEFVLAEVIDEAAGSLFMAIGIGLGVGDGPYGNAPLATVTFDFVGECAACNLEFGGENPMNMYLVSGGEDPGQPITVNPIKSKTIKENGDLTIWIPDGGEYNIPCHGSAVEVTWEKSDIGAADTCYDAFYDCAAYRMDQWGMVHDASEYINSGGVFPIGTATFCCWAWSECGHTAGYEPKVGGDIQEGCWTVQVNDETTLDVTIEVSPSATSKPADGITRCIKFEVFFNTVQEPLVFQEDVMFGGEFGLVGHFKDSIKIPGHGNIECISARDQLHTLRSCARVDILDTGACVADFKGDPFFGGHWLVSGNLDGFKKDNPLSSHDVIDILDFGMFVVEYLVDYGTGDTPCKTDGPHADINGDGVVDMLDFAFIDMNFLASSKDCLDECGEGAAAGGILGRTEVSLQELRQMGLSELAVADLNNDGVLSTADMTAFMEGKVPSKKAPTRGGVR